MKFSNKKKDFFRNKEYKLFCYSRNFCEVTEMFINIAEQIGMPKQRAIEEVYRFAMAKNKSSALIATMLFGSPEKANKYIQGLNKKTFSILQEYIKKFKILEPTRSYEA